MLRIRETSTRGTIREWRFRYKLKGETNIITMGQFPGVSLAEARARALRFRDLLQDGIDPRTAIARRRGARIIGPLTVSPAATTDAQADGAHMMPTLIKEFLEMHVQKHRRRPEEVERILNKELGAWMHRDARTIRPREVVELLDAIVARGAPIMANRVGGIISQMFRFGIHRQIVETSPVQLLFRPGGTERPRQRAFDDEELAAMLSNIDDVTKRAKRTGIAIRLILLTAVRRSELTAARWSEFDLEAKKPVWSIPGARTKTAVTHIVPLTAPAVAQLERLKRTAGRSPWLFANEAGDGPMDPRLLTRSVARHLETFADHKVAAFTLHDLRRTVRTGLAKLGVRPDIAERCLNHAQPGIVATYDVHQYLDEKRDALTRWATHLRKLANA
jgi:integrase